MTLWDPFGVSRAPVRATVSDMGLLLLGRMLDLKDLRAMLAFVGENARQFTADYGSVSPASIRSAAIQRINNRVDLDCRVATRLARTICSVVR